MTWERDKEDFIWSMVGLTVVEGRYMMVVKGVAKEVLGGTRKMKI